MRHVPGDRDLNGAARSNRPVMRRSPVACDPDCVSVISIVPWPADTTVLLLKVPTQCPTPFPGQPSASSRPIRLLRRTPPSRPQQVR